MADSKTSPSQADGAQPPGAPGTHADGDEETTGRAPAFPIVGIGASAGGLEALQTLIGRLSQDDTAYVVLQHLAPGYDSLLTEILSRATSMNVVTARDGLEVAVNNIYVTPPAVTPAIRQGILRFDRPSEPMSRHPIDGFFRALASDSGPAAIGVVLSGAGSDGTLGLRAIQEAGGITFAQEPSTAAQASMPQSAIDAGCADFCLTPAEIGDELMRISSHPYVARKRPTGIVKREVLTQIFDHLQRGFGVDFSSYKSATIERRIGRRMALQKIEKVEDYLRLIETNAEELSHLYADLLIGVSAFFRDQAPFEALKTTVFPRLFDQRSTDVPIRIWVPGCASGEEAYSIAMCLLEYLDGRPAGFKVQIFGTDIDDRALARAKQGHYPASIELDVPPARLQRFFSKQEKGYQVSQQVREMVLFTRHNLGKDPPFSRLDLISCRNVLIYLQPPLQKRVLRAFHYALGQGGTLLLGTSESVGEESDLFSLVDKKLKIYIKKSVASAGVFDFVFGPRLGKAETEPDASPTQGARRPTVSLQQMADRAVMDKFGPPGVLVDEHMQIVQFRGQTAPYLAPSPGAATLNVLKLIRPELMVEVRAAIKTAIGEGRPVTSAPLPLGGGGPRVVLEVMPLKDPGSDRRCVLVLFRETPAEAVVPVREALVAESDGPRGAGTQLGELERELLVTKEYLQTTVQDLEASNEALQSSNEELQSSNEELQSTNEELSTSKEELQSTNEELATVNEELQNRMSQLAISNDDLENVLASVSAPFIIVGADLRIRRYSAEAARLLSLVPADLGRPISYLGSLLDAPEFEAAVAATIKTARERAQRVRGSDGRWYTMRVLPYRTSEHSIRGAVIELAGAPAVGKASDRGDIHDLIGKVLSTLPHILMLLDGEMRIAWVNRAFFETFGVGAEIIGQALEEVWPSRASLPELWSALDEAIGRGTPFDNLWVAHPFGREDDRPMKFGARHIPAEGERSAVTLVVMDEAPSSAADKVS